MLNRIAALLLFVLLLAVPAGASYSPPQDDIRTAGSITTSVLNQDFRVQLNAAGVVGFAVNGLTGTGATLALEYSNDGGTTWSPLNEIISGGAATNLLTTNLQFRVTASGHTQIRLRVSIIGTGTATVAVNLSVPASVVGIRESLPPGSNTIGAVTPGTNPWPVQLVAGGALSGSSLGVTQTTVPWVVNLSQVNGNAAQQAGVNGTLSVGGNQAPGSAISTEVNPIPTGGSDYAGTPLLRQIKVDSSGNQYVVVSNGLISTNADTNLTAGTAPAKALAAAGQYNTSNPTPTNGQTVALQMGPLGELKVGGQNPAGSAAAGNPLLGGCRSVSTEPAAVTDGQANMINCGLSGKLIIIPYTNKENALRGAASATGTGATTLTGMGAQGVGVVIYVTSVECGRTDTGTAAITVTFNDSASTVMVIPNAGNGGGSNMNFPVPLAVASNTAFTFTSGTGVTTLYCNAQGYKGA